MLRGLREPVISVVLVGMDGSARKHDGSVGDKAAKVVRVHVVMRMSSPCSGL